MDREKVIKGLELCEIGSGDRCYETECPYYGQECTEGLKNDILALLKEQEPEKPIAKEDDTYECCSCGAIVGWDELDASGIVETRFNYCPFCGRSVKWYET